MSVDPWVTKRLFIHNLRQYSLYFNYPIAAGVLNMVSLLAGTACNCYYSPPPPRLVVLHVWNKRLPQRCGSVDRASSKGLSLVQLNWLMWVQIQVPNYKVEGENWSEFSPSSNAEIRARSEGKNCLESASPPLNLHWSSSGGQIGKVK